MLDLNFHHLRYFWAVAKEGNLTRAAQQLRVAPSALSAQIRQLEAQLDQDLFTRDGRRLLLTEAGKIALAHAEEIFATGARLSATLSQGRSHEQVFRIGAVATFSRNFLSSFVRPIFDHPEERLRLESGSHDALLLQLEHHALDLVLSNRQAPRDRRFRSRRLGRQPVSIVATKRPARFRFPRDLSGQGIILPSPESELRSDFDALCERHDVKVNVLAEIDDMGMIRLLARDTGALALVPAVVVHDELQRGVLRELCVVPEIVETFYAITVERNFQHPLLRKLLSREDELLPTS